jgi:hypothetical protein
LNLHHRKSPAYCVTDRDNEPRISLQPTLTALIMSSDGTASDALLREILETLKTLKTDNTVLAASVDKINGRVNMLASVKQIKDEAALEAARGSLSNNKAKEADTDKAVEAVSQQYDQPPANAVDASPRLRVKLALTRCLWNGEPRILLSVDLLLFRDIRIPFADATVCFLLNSIYNSLTSSSHWRTWRFLFHLQRSGSS